MRADAFFAAAEALPIVSVEEIAPPEFVIMAPHPDDESLGCGGLISGACARGLPVHLVVVSDGAGSHPNSRKYPPERLRDLRESETLAAAEALGLSHDAVSFLRLRDRFIPSEGAEAEQAARRIARDLAPPRPFTLAATWRHDPHCDHASSFAIAKMIKERRRDVRLLAYPIWGWSLPPHFQIDDDFPRGFRLDIEQTLPAKRRAITAHRSQTSDMIDDDPNSFRLDPAMVARFERPFELYLDCS